MEIIQHPTQINNSLKPETEVDLKKISRELWKKLPEIAMKLINENTNFDKQDRETIVKNLLNKNFHNLSWHTYDILTHSVMVQRAIIRLEEVFKKYDTAGVMNKKVGGFSKWALFRLFAGTLHDLGKWGGSAQRTAKDGRGMYQEIIQDGKKITAPILTFKKHEEKSGVIISDKHSFVNKELDNLLEKSGIVNKQDRKDIIEYLRRVSQYHFELGIIRDIAKKSKYTFSDWIDTEDCTKELLKILNNPDTKPYALEIILFFLADTDAKMDQKSIIGIMDGLPEKYTTVDILHNLIKPLPNMSYQTNVEGRQNMSLIEHIATKYPEIVPIKDQLLKLKDDKDLISNLASDLDSNDPKLDLSKIIKKSPYLPGVIQYPDNLKLFKKAMEIYKELMGNKTPQERLKLLIA